MGGMGGMPGMGGMGVPPEFMNLFNEPELLEALKVSCLFFSG